MWDRVVKERNSTCIFFYYTVSGPPCTVYTYWDIVTENIWQIFIRKWALTNQRSERCFSHVKKKEKSNHNREQCFFKGEKNGMSNQKPQRCVSFAPEFLLFISACSLQCPRFASCFAKTFNVKRKSEKRLGNWIGTVLYISLSTREDKAQSSLAIDNASVDWTWRKIAGIEY